MEILPYCASFLPALKEALSGACTWLELPHVLEEKLGPGAAGDARVRVSRADDEIAGVAVSCGDRLRLLAVAPGQRSRGIGSALLADVEAWARDTGTGRLSVADEPGNYVAPGIIATDEGTLGWFERREYRRHSKNHSLLIDLGDDSCISGLSIGDAVAPCRAQGYEVLRLPKAEIPRLSRQILESHSPAWAMEVTRAANGESGGVWIARASGEIVAFAAHNGNNQGLGGFGPAATVPEHRGKGLGAALLLCCLYDIAERGLSRAVVAWIGPRDFYDRVCGISKDLDYIVLRKDL